MQRHSQEYIELFNLDLCLKPASSHVSVSYMYLRVNVDLFFLADMQLLNQLMAKDGFLVLQSLTLINKGIHQVSGDVTSHIQLSEKWLEIHCLSIVNFIYLLFIFTDSAFILSFLPPDWWVIVGVIVAVAAILLICAAVAKRKRYLFYCCFLLLIFCTHKVFMYYNVLLDMNTHLHAVHSG